MTKFKRRQTTMGDGGSEMKKPMKTYGSRTTLDDLGLRSSGNQVTWEISPRRKRRVVNDENDTAVVLSPSRDRKKKSSAIGTRLVDGGSMSQKDTMGEAAYGSSAKSPIYSKADDISGHSSLQQSRDREVSAEKVSSSGLARAEGDELDSQAVVMQQGKKIHNGNSPPMDHPLNEDSHATMSVRKSIFDSTVKLADTLPSDIFMQGTEHPINKNGGADFQLFSNPDSNGQHSELSFHELAESRIPQHLQSNHHQAQENQCQHANSPSRTRRDADPDELALQNLGRSDDDVTHKVSKAKPKRKVEYQDELGSDELDIGLPKENYKPRPSRSRSNRTMDDLALAIDLLEQPESLLKAKRKNKRRKTMGDELVPAENMEPREMNPVEVRISGKESHPIQLDDVEIQQVDEVTETTARAIKSSTIRETEDILDMVAEHREPASEIAELVTDPASHTVAKFEPKKKRGRPKKQSVEPMEHNDTDTDPEKVPCAVIDTPSDQEAAQIPPAKKPRKREVEEASPVMENMAAGASEVYLEDGEPSVSRRALSDVQDKANITILSAKSAEPFKDVKESTPAPVQITPLQTPQKPAERAPDKHSPINSGKVPHRVGLSKRARIEPLLRIVKK